MSLFLFSCQVGSDSATSWTVARQAPPSMGFSRQEYWGALLFPPPGDLPDPGIEPVSPVAPRHGHIYTLWFREMNVLLGGLWF